MKVFEYTQQGSRTYNYDRKYVKYKNIPGAKDNFISSLVLDGVGDTTIESLLDKFVDVFDLHFRNTESYQQHSFSPKSFFSPSYSNLHLLKKLHNSMVVDIPSYYLNTPKEILSFLELKIKDFLSYVGQYWVNRYLLSEHNKDEVDEHNDNQTYISQISNFVYPKIKTIIENINKHQILKIDWQSVHLKLHKDPDLDLRIEISFEIFKIVKNPLSFDDITKLFEKIISENNHLIDKVYIQKFFTNDINSGGFEFEKKYYSSHVPKSAQGLSENNDEIIARWNMLFNDYAHFVGSEIDLKKNSTLAAFVFGAIFIRKGWLKVISCGDISVFGGLKNRKRVVHLNEEFSENTRRLELSPEQYTYGKWVNHEGGFQNYSSMVHTRILVNQIERNNGEEIVEKNLSFKSYDAHKFEWILLCSDGVISNKINKYTLNLIFNYDIKVHKDEHPFVVLDNHIEKHLNGIKFNFLLWKKFKKERKTDLQSLFYLNSDKVKTSNNLNDWYYKVNYAHESRRITLEEKIMCLNSILKAQHDDNATYVFIKYDMEELENN